jgi:hypothetical protein
MHESIAESLSRFTPDRGGLDRDALLFAGGQASARRSTKNWGVLVGTLAACQVLTLVLLWQSSQPPSVPYVEARPAGVNQTAADSPVHEGDPTGLLALTRQVMKSDDSDLPPQAGAESLVIEPTPLRAGAAFVYTE